MSFPTVIFEHFFHSWTFGQNFETHNQPTYIIVYSICLRRVLEIFDQDQSLQTHAYWDNFHGKLVKLERVFSQLFYFQCHSENQYKSSACMLVSCGNWNFDSKCQTKKLVRKLPSVWMRHVSWIWPPFFHLILNLNLGLIIVEYWIINIWRKNKWPVFVGISLLVKFWLICTLHWNWHQSKG